MVFYSIWLHIIPQFFAAATLIQKHYQHAAMLPIPHLYTIRAVSINGDTYNNIFPSWSQWSLINFQRKDYFPCVITAVSDRMSLFATILLDVGCVGKICTM